MSGSRWIAVGALSGALTVALGAFGAHFLKERATPEELLVWQTGVHYQGLHALALVLVGLWLARGHRGGIACWCFLAGSAIFAGTLYGMVLGGPRWLGAITPIGGSLLIAGWLVFGWVAWRER